MGLDEVGHLLSHDLGPGQSEEAAEGVVGPGDPERRIEEKRAHRRVLQHHEVAPRGGGRTTGAGLCQLDESPPGGERQGQCYEE